MDLHTLHIRTASLSILGNLRSSALLRAYRDAMQALSEDPISFAQAYGALCEHIYRTGDAGTEFSSLVTCDDNALTKHLDHIPPMLLAAATYDLETLSALLTLSGQDFLSAAAAAFPSAGQALQSLPNFTSGTALPFSTGNDLVSYYQTNGYGFFAKASFFTVDQNRQILPIENPDSTQISDLKGYTRQKDQVISNTLAFLEGGLFNNILLYGDKGTGKSSTVKAVVNAFSSRGLKIIELPLQQINIFPTLCAQAARSPFRVIVFLDDLSFESDDENFASLKAFIEGGLTGKPENMAIYATSNRRHLIRESFADRQGDDIHRRDTLETITSLSDRFGLEITFSVPDKDEYLSIVDQLAEEYGLALPTDQLHLLAERFALRRNGRSPRTARQFLSYYLAQNRSEN